MQNFFLFEQINGLDFFRVASTAERIKIFDKFSAPEGNPARSDKEGQAGLILLDVRFNALDQGIAVLVCV